jgi:hypothetical protein
MRERHTGFEWESLDERKCLEDPYVEWIIVLKWTESYDVWGWTRFIWLKIGVSGRVSSPW